MAKQSGRIGPQLKALRLRTGESVRSFAKRAGLSHKRVYQVESGITEYPGISTLDPMARALGTSIQELLPDQLLGGAPFRSSDRSIPPSLARFIREWESAQKSRMPKDILRSLATLQFRGKRPRTVNDWRVIYALVDWIVTD